MSHRHQDNSTLKLYKICYHCASNYWYCFNLSPLLRINFTFSPIYSIFGRIEIWNLPNNESSFTFKGHYSTFYLYLQFKDFYLQVMPNAGKYVFEAIFTVMDKQLIYNLPVYKFRKITPNFIYKIKNKYMLTSYFLQVRKLYQLFIQILQQTKY